MTMAHSPMPSVEDWSGAVTEAERRDARIIRQAAVMASSATARQMWLRDRVQLAALELALDQALDAVMDLRNAARPG